MHTSTQTNWRLGGFVQRALDSLASENRVNVWGQSTAEIEKAADGARLRMCALAHAFHEAGKAIDRVKHVSGEQSEEFARLLLQLAVRAWPYQRRRMGWKVEVNPEGKEAWHQLQEHLKTFFLGGSDAATAVRDAIRTICESALTGADAQAATPNEVSPPAVGPVAPAKVPKRPKATVNARMLETIQANQEALGWNSRQWAEHLKCGKPAVVATQTWKDLAMGRERSRAERARDRRRRPKASDQRRD